MLHAVWKGASLRAWIAISMALAVVPLGVSGIAGYFLLTRGVVASFQDVAARQRNAVDPLQRLRLEILEAEAPLDDYVDDGDPHERVQYRAIRKQVEADFATVHGNAAAEAELRSLVERARDDWTAADRIATDIMAVRRAPGDTTNDVLMDRFQGLIRSSTDKLGVVFDNVDQDIHADHDAALRDVARSDVIAAAATTLSVLAIIIGVVLIGRVIGGSVERLVAGAELFAAGDRIHRIDVAVPPELHRVAEEFNRMIGRIHDSEAALADLARRDALTLLLNRRAFDEELAEVLARQARFGDGFALLALDLDHFKTVNDSHGHIAGDEVLRAVGRAIANDLRPFDHAFRTGGEEFAVILTGGDALNARLSADRVRQAVAAHPVTVDGQVFTTTVSVGVAMATPGIAAATLIAKADAALYRAKEAGRNRVVVSGEPDAA